MGRALAMVCGVVLFAAASNIGALAQEKPRIKVDSYQIDVRLVPAAHKLFGRAKVTFTALEDVNIAVFELNNALRPTRVTDAAGNSLSPERVTQDSTIRVPLAQDLAKGSSTTVTIEYEGILQTGEDSPVEGLKLAYVGDEESYLLYPGRWFPVVGYGTNRFTADINVTVPAGYTVIGSGPKGSAPATAWAEAGGEEKTVVEKGKRKKIKERKEKASKPEPGMTTFSFAWDKPSFPGTILAGKFREYKAASNVSVYFLDDHAAQESAYGDSALKAFQAYSVLYGAAPSFNLNLVELPGDTVPSAWAPQIAAIGARSISDKVNYRLVANAVAHQWWGVSVSPATRDDWWLSDGFARYSELLYIQQMAGQAAFEDAVSDVSVGALAYDTVPLSTVGKLDTFSPEFQSLTTNKGAAILNMLRWVIGDDAFDKTMKDFATQYAGKSATTDDFRKIAEADSGEQLSWFFIQWFDSTGAPAFKNKYTVYRLGNNKGFRIVGQISQDLDLFRMPVELKVETDGKTEMKRIEVVGTNSPYSVETFGMPRRISIDPNDRVLQNSPNLKVRVAILRGQELVQQGDLAGALQQFQDALKLNSNSSLAHYRTAEVFRMQRNLQAAANEYREAYDGDGEPPWTIVWSHLELGKIFDMTGQRERAVNEYRQALQTNDNTSGALEEARKYLQKPYSPEKKDAIGE